MGKVSIYCFALLAWFKGTDSKSFRFVPVRLFMVWIPFFGSDRREEKWLFCSAHRSITGFVFGFKGLAGQTEILPFTNLLPGFPALRILFER